MNIANIKDRELREIICNTLGRSGDAELYEEDLEGVKSIVINKYKLSGEMREIDISELVFLTNINYLTIANSEITKKEIEILNKLKTVNILQFVCCDFNSITDKIELDLDYLILEVCQNLNLGIFAQAGSLKKLRLVGEDEFDMRRIRSFNNIEILYIKDCSVRHIEDIAGFRNLKYLELERSIVDKPEILDRLNIEVKQRGHRA